MKTAFSWYMILDHVDSFDKFSKFLPKHFFYPCKKKMGPKHCFCRFLKNTVPCEFPFLKLHNFYILHLLSFQVIKTVFTKSYPVPNYEGVTILKRQISQKIFTSEFVLPDSQKCFNALFIVPILEEKVTQTYSNRPEFEPNIVKTIPQSRHNSVTI